MDDFAESMRHLPYSKQPHLIFWLDQARAFMNEHPVYTCYTKAYHRGLFVGAQLVWLKQTAQLAYQYCMEQIEDDPDTWKPMAEDWRKDIDEASQRIMGM